MTNLYANTGNALNRQDIYSRITNKIITDLEAGVRPWMKPWNAEHAAGRITRPLRYNGIPYQGINILVLWSTAETKGYAAPIWMTYKQARELGGNVRKGEQGELVGYANKLVRTNENDRGEEVEQAIPFLKGYTVFKAVNRDTHPKKMNQSTVEKRVSLASRFDFLGGWIGVDQIIAGDRQTRGEMIRESILGRSIIRESVLLVRNEVY